MTLRRFSAFVLGALVALPMLVGTPAQAREHRGPGLVGGLLLGAVVGAAVGVAIAPPVYAAPGYPAPIYPRPVFGPHLLPPVMVEFLPPLPAYVGPGGVVVGRTFDGHAIVAMPAQELPPMPFTHGNAVVPVIAYGPGVFAPVVLRPRAPIYGYQGGYRPY